MQTKKDIRKNKQVLTSGRLILVMITTWEMMKNFHVVFAWKYMV